jgi:hypothetical protein
MRTTISIYRQLGRYLEAADAAYTVTHANGHGSDGSLEDPSIDVHFRSGVYLGVGLSHLILSLMPGRLLTIVELFGYRGDRKEGLRMLNRAGGWDAYGERSVISQGRSSVASLWHHHGAVLRNPAESEGVRRAICDMCLLSFHLVLSSYTFEGVDVPMARRIVEWNLQRYPNGASSTSVHHCRIADTVSGVFFLFGAGRLALARSQPQQSLEYYARAAQAQSQYRNMHHVSWWESAIANLALWNVDASKDWWCRLRGEATVSLILLLGCAWTQGTLWTVVQSNLYVWRSGMSRDSW